MSKKTSLIVDNRTLDFLHKVDLPDRCMIRFGDYQILMEKEDGVSLEFFETEFILSPRSLLQENDWPPQNPIPEYCHSVWFSPQSTSPMETDENEL